MAYSTIFTKKTIIGKTIFASLLAIGVAGSVQAQGVGNIVGGGSAIVGGGSATITGGGDNMQITYSASGAGGGGGLVDQSARLATFAGSDGDGPRWNYGAPPDGNPGREAWMTGGGDNAQVVYVSPYSHR